MINSVHRCLTQDLGRWIKLKFQSCSLCVYLIKFLAAIAGIKLPFHPFALALKTSASQWTLCNWIFCEVISGYFSFFCLTTACFKININIIRLHICFLSGSPWIFSWDHHLLMQLKRWAWKTTPGSRLDLMSHIDNQV